MKSVHSSQQRRKPVEREASASDDPVSSSTQVGKPEADTPTQAKPGLKTRLLWRVPVVVAGLLGVFFLWQSIGLGLGTLRQPDSGLWPVIVSVVLIVAAVAAILVEKGEHAERFDRHSLRIVAGVVALYLFVVAFSYLGVILPAAVLLVVWLRFLAGESWRVSLSIGLVGSFVCYGIFVGLLGVVFPDDLVAQLWGGR